MLGVIFLGIMYFSSGSRLKLNIPSSLKVLIAIK